MTTDKQQHNSSVMLDEQQPMTPGQKLKQARQSAGLDINQIVDNLHLTRSKVESIENDDYSKVTNFVFVRGYLRAYAKLLGLSTESIVADFERLGVDKKEIEPPITLKSNQVSIKQRFLPLFSGIFIFVVIIFLFLWWHSQHGSATLNVSHTQTNVQTTNTASTQAVTLNSQSSLTTQNNKMQQLKTTVKPQTKIQSNATTDVNKSLSLTANTLGNNNQIDTNNVLQQSNQSLNNSPQLSLSQVPNSDNNGTLMSKSAKHPEKEHHEVQLANPFSS